MAASSFWESLDLAYPEGFGLHHTPPRALFVGSVLAGKRSMVHAIKNAHDQRTASASGTSTSSSSSSAGNAPAGPRRQPALSFQNPAADAALGNSLRPHGMGLEHTYVVRENGKAVEMFICDKPELLKLCIDQARIASTVVVYVVDGSEAAGMSKEVSRWISAVNKVVRDVAGQQQAQQLLTERQEHWSRQSALYEQQDESTSLRRVVAQRYRDTIGHGKEPGEAGHPVEDEDAISLLPSLLALTKLDMLEKVCRVPIETSQRMLLHQLPLLHFVLQTARKIALGSRSAIVALNSKSPTELNTSLYVALLRYLTHMHRAAAESTSSKFVGEHDGGPSSDEAVKSGGIVAIPSIPDGIVTMGGNHVFLPHGFDEYRVLHSIVFSPDMASIADFLPLPDGTGGDSGGGPLAELHDKILREMKEAENRFEKNVWD